MPPVITGNKVPLYTQIAQTIKQRVRTGVYQSGQTLPSVRALCQEFGVSVKAVHQAVRHLEERGIITTHPGKGMTVASEEHCDKAAIVFGFIHPYGTSLSFSSSVLGFVSEAFEGRSNLCVVSSSKDDPAREREVARHLIANGVKGLMVWPTNNDPNGAFFEALSDKMPVVLVDRLLQGADLPAVVLDYYHAGQDIVRHLFKTLKKKRLLVLMDDLRISSYEDIMRGITHEVATLGRETDMTVVQLPMTKVIEDVTRMNFAGIDRYSQHIDRLLEEGSYDAAYCFQGPFINLVLVETGVMDKHRSVKLVTMADTANLNTAGKKFNELGILRWVCDSTGMVAKAADLVQRWVLTRQAPKGVIRTQLQMGTFECIGTSKPTE